jgi:predicted nucleic acid-binding protein
MYFLLTSFPHFELVAPDAPIALRVAGLRAERGLRTPDAIHIATAIERGGTVFLTNDRRLATVQSVGLGVLILDDFVNP